MIASVLSKSAAAIAVEKGTLQTPLCDQSRISFGGGGAKRDQKRDQKQSGYSSEVSEEN